MESLGLADITDLLIPADDALRAHAYPGPVMARDSDVVARIAQKLFEKATAAEADAFQAEIEDSGQILIFRGQRTDTHSGRLFACRRLFTEAKPLETLHGKGVCDILMSPKLRSGGVIIIAGGPGHGKTTTLAATVAGRLQAHGGVCVAAEDPPEIPLAGFHGTGFCMQLQVTETESLAFRLHQSLRLFPVAVPTMLMIGEIRGKEAASEAMAAGLNGTLVLFTLHASSPEEAIQRFVGMAGGDETAHASLASCLRVVIHQKLEPIPGGGKRVVVKPLVLTEGDYATRGNIRRGKIELLASVLDQQARDLSQGRPIPV